MPTSGAASPLSVGFTVKDMGRSLAFYRDVLGFEMKECWPWADDPWWCSLQLAGQTVMLGLDMGAPSGEASHDEAGADVDWHRAAAEAWRRGPAGVGVSLYLMVPDVDAFHEQVAAAGGEPRYAPKSQFYGIRDFGIEDPDGYRLIFYTPITLETCQSCGMRMSGAQPGQMHCASCTDDAGQLRSYEDVLEAVVTGHFMQKRHMGRAEAELAAHEHLRRLPAWSTRDAGIARSERDPADDP